MTNADRDGERTTGVWTGAGGGERDAGPRRPDRRGRPAARAMALALTAGALGLGMAACARAAPDASGTAVAGSRPAASAGPVASAVPVPGPAPVASSAPSATSATPPPAGAAGWRIESSLGVQIEVPAGWAVNDYGCNMSQGPTVVRAQGMQRLCLTAETPEKQVAIIGPDAPDDAMKAPGLTRRGVSLGGVSAERTEGRGADGRHLGWLRIPSQRVLISVRAHDPEIARRILDSAQLVSVDHNGCPARRPPGKRPQATHPGARSTMAPGSPSSISICYYGTDADALLTSARLSGQEAAALAAALSSTAPGPNPDADPKECLLPPTPPPADAVLLVEDAAGRGAIHVAFSGCTGRGLDNGALRAHVNVPLIKLVMTPLGTGYTFNGDLAP
ncbi:hypothetical protein WME99_32025 [Sorangium sp. So ce136]|uniref:hypothetical protein n=1 Tax=Sorangium sp. So ce136 TaxID=3133284 RepID=UPI003F0AB0B6